MKTRQIRDESTTREMYCIVCLFLSYFRFFVSKFKKRKKKKKKKHEVKLCRICAFLHCCILRRKSEITTWGKSATKTYVGHQTQRQLILSLLTRLTSVNCWSYFTLYFTESSGTSLKIPLSTQGILLMLSVILKMFLM